MKKILTTVILTIMLSLTALAQKTVEATDDFTTYNRNSVSVITINYNDQYDDFFSSLVSSFDIGYKFDINKIKTKSIALNGKRTTPIDHTTWAPSKSAAKINSLSNASGMHEKYFNQLLNNIGFEINANEAFVNTVLSHLNENNVGKQIFDYILAPTKEGIFTREIIDDRGLWNASDNEYLESQMQQVNTLGQNGEFLLKNSYIVVFDMKNPNKDVVTTKDKNGKTNKSYKWSANVLAYVFTIANADEVINDILENMWIYNTDDAATKAAKRKAYKELEVEMELVTAVGLNKTDEYLDVALESIYDDLLTRLEQKIEKWQVTIDCQTVRPYITANAGIKEGIKNAQRYAIYKQVYNKETKNVELKRQGYARATEVADNAKVADGQNDTTYFYRISGLSILKGTEIMKQSNDLRMGFHTNLNLGINSFSTIDIGVDYLTYIQKNGISHYALLNFGYDLDLLDSYDATFLNISLGYMLGLKLKTLLEIQPYATATLDFVDAAFLTDNDIMDYTAYFANAGVRVVLNTFYPFQLYAQGSFSIKLSEGWNYYRYGGSNRDVCIGLGAGFRYCF